MSGDDATNVQQATLKPADYVDEDGELELLKLRRAVKDDLVDGLLPGEKGCVCVCS